MVRPVQIDPLGSIDPTGERSKISRGESKQSARSESFIDCLHCFSRRSEMLYHVPHSYHVHGISRNLQIFGWLRYDVADTFASETLQGI